MADTFTVERTRRIDAPPEAVRHLIVDLHRWREWSPWEDVDPNIHREYGGPPSGLGAWYAWAGNRRAGKGRMEIIEADNSTVRLDLQFLRPFRSHSNTIFELQPDGEGTEVTWRLVGPSTRMTRVLGLFSSMDKMLGPDLEKGLERLGDRVERGPSSDPAAGRDADPAQPPGAS